MELHYVINETMRPLAECFFLPSIPAGFCIVEHYVSIATSGDFMEDNFGKLVLERTRLIVDEIAANLDGKRMLWCDVDIAFSALSGLKVGGHLTAWFFGTVFKKASSSEAAGWPRMRLDKPSVRGDSGGSRMVSV